MPDENLSKQLTGVVLAGEAYRPRDVGRGAWRQLPIGWEPLGGGCTE
jgi:hypothetical protein